MADERKVPVLRSDNSLIDQEFDSIRDKFELEMRKMEEEMSRFRSQLIASEQSRVLGKMSSQSKSSMETSIDGRNQSRRFEQSSEASQNQNEATSTSSQTRAQNSYSSSEQKRDGHREEIRSSTRTSRTTTSTMSSYDKSHTLVPDDKRAFDSMIESHSWMEQIDSPLIKDDLTSGGGAKMLKLRFDVSSYEPEQIVVKTIDNRLQVHARREEKTETTSRYLEYNREFLLPAGTDPELIRSSLSADGILTVEAPLPQINARKQEQLM